MNKSGLLRIFQPQWLAILLMLLMWQFFADWFDKPGLIPSVTDILKTLRNFILESSFYLHLFGTLARGILGFLLALIFALLFAIFALHRPFLKSFFHPFIVTMRSIPVISVVLFALLWFSPPVLPVFIAVLTMFPILYQNILSGLEQTDIKLIEMAKVYKKNAVQRLKYIYLPGASKFISDGMSTATGFGWRAVIIGEVLATPVHAIGTGMKNAQSYIQINELLGWTIIAIIISFAFEFLIKKIHAGNKHKFLRLSNQLSEVPAILSENLKSENAIISLYKLTKQFKSKIVIKNFSQDFYRQNIYSLNAPSGSGKTTLLKILAGITKKDSGDVFIKRNTGIAYAFQDIRLIPWLTIEENIAFALPSFPFINNSNFHKLMELAASAGLSEILKAYPHQISGGEGKRVEVLRALINPVDLLLLDEVLAGLDITNKKLMLSLIENYISNCNPVTLWVSHENTAFNMPVHELVLIVTDNSGD